MGVRSVPFPRWYGHRVRPETNGMHDENLLRTRCWGRRWGRLDDHPSYLPFSGSVMPQLAYELKGNAMTKSALHFRGTAAAEDARTEGDRSASGNSVEILSLQPQPSLGVPGTYPHDEAPAGLLLQTGLFAGIRPVGAPMPMPEQLPRREVLRCRNAALICRDFRAVPAGREALGRGREVLCYTKSGNRSG